MTTGPPPRGAHPRVLLASVAEQLGQQAVVAWCCRLVRGQEQQDDPDLAWLGGNDDWPPYWRRVWGARGLLYVWHASAMDALEQVLADEHWRVREMGCKVVRAHRLTALSAEVVPLREDPHPRVRAAAERALAAPRPRVTPEARRGAGW